MNTIRTILTCLCLLTAVSGCTRTSIPDQSIEKREPQNDSSCKVIDSRHWHAWVDQLSSINRKGRLIVVGQVDFPTPGFTINLRTMALDRANPPALRIVLEATEPEGPTMQVVTSTPVRFELENSLLNYREIIISCEGQVLATIPDVTPTD